MSTNEEIAAFYDKYTTHQQKVAYNERHLFLNDKLKQYGLSRTSNVLEIGCGIGVMSTLILKKIGLGSLVSIDISPKSVEIAKANCEKYSNVSFLAGDICELPIPRKDYDFILLFDVLEHIPLKNQQILFSKLSNIANDATQIIINVPYAMAHDYFINNAKEHFQIIEQPIYIYDLLQVLNVNELELRELYTYGLWQKDEYQLCKIVKKRKYRIEPLESKTGFRKYFSK